VAPWLHLTSRNRPGRAVIDDKVFDDTVKDAALIGAADKKVSEKSSPRSIRLSTRWIGRDANDLVPRRANPYPPSKRSRRKIRTFRQNVSKGPIREKENIDFFRTFGSGRHPAHWTESDQIRKWQRYQQ
jgi:hypothetical protein